MRREPPARPPPKAMRVDMSYPTRVGLLMRREDFEDVNKIEILLEPIYTRTTTNYPGCYPK